MLVCLCFSLPESILIGNQVSFPLAESVLPPRVKGEQSPCLYLHPQALSSYSAPLSHRAGGVKGCRHLAVSQGCQRASLGKETTQEPSSKTPQAQPFIPFQGNVHSQV